MHLNFLSTINLFFLIPDSYQGHNKREFFHRYITYIQIKTSHFGKAKIPDFYWCRLYFQGPLPFPQHLTDFISYLNVNVFFANGCVKKYAVIDDQSTQMLIPFNDYLQSLTIINIDFWLKISPVIIKINRPVFFLTLSFSFCQ